MRYYIIAGEASGDLHGSNLINALKHYDKAAEFRCWGGDLMEAASGTRLVKHYKDTAFMGLVEVVKHLKTILGLLKMCKQDIAFFNPDVVILIDYPGFNLRIAQFTKLAQITTFYYIAPQVWAWHRSRTKHLQKYTDFIFVILPFEVAFFKQHGIKNVAYFGHPMLDAIHTQDRVQATPAGAPQNLPVFDKPVIALLPGSRRQEVERILPVMASVQAFFPQYRFVVAGVGSLPVILYEKILNSLDIPVVFNQTQPLLRHAAAALVASGTATLETALLNVPQVVCYRANPLSVAIARWLVKVRFISLVNLIAGKEVVRELIQQNCTTKELTAELNHILPHQPRRAVMLKNYALLHKKLGKKGVSAKVAQAMIKLLLSSFKRKEQNNSLKHEH